MDGCPSQTHYEPLTPVSPNTPLLDCPPFAHRQDGPNTWYRLHTPMSPESMRGMDMDAKNECDVGDSKSFERALAELVHDRKAYSTVENRYRGHSDISMAKTEPKKMSPPSTMKISRDNRKLQADIKRGRPPQGLAATHPTLYNRPLSAQQRKMLPTPPPTDYPEGKISFQQRRQTVCEPPSPPWRNYTDPNRQASGEPKFDDPKYKMLKMDLEPRQPKVLSPTFMIGLPCGSMIEAANQYPDARPSRPRDTPSA